MRLPGCEHGRKNTAMDEEIIIGCDSLYTSMYNCQKGVIWKDSVAHFVLNAPEEILKLERELKDGTYRPRKPKMFMVTSPKPREISSIPFRDRVYQRSLNDNVLYPTMTKSFIYDNWACQKGKGTDHARDRLRDFFRRYYRKYGTEGYIAQFDVSGYYPNMDHGYIEGMFQKKLEPEPYERVKAVLRHQYPGSKGYNPGSQMIQIAGISALNELDHYVKEQLHVRLYIRYMDDFILIHHDRSFLEDCQSKIIEKLHESHFEINRKKTKIVPISEGVSFLGFQYRLTETGKVLLFVSPKNVKAKRKNLRRLVAKSKRGELPKSSVDDSYRSWRDHASKGNSYKLLLRMDKYYKNLWEAETNAENHQEAIPLGERGGNQPAQC